MVNPTSPKVQKCEGRRSGQGPHGGGKAGGHVRLGLGFKKARGHAAEARCRFTTVPCAFWWFPAPVVQCVVLCRFCACFFLMFSCIGCRV